MVAGPMDRFARAVANHPRAVIVIVALITAGFAFFARQARIDSSVATLVDPMDPAVRYYEEVREIFGSDEIDMVAVVADDVFTPRTLAKIKDLSERLQAIDGVAHVASLATERNLRATAEGDIDNSPLMEAVPSDPASIARLRAAVYDNPLLANNLVSRDGRAAAILITYDRMPDPEFVASGINDAVASVVAQAQGPEEVYLSGIPTLKVRSAQLMSADMVFFGPLSFAVICVVLLLAFRTFRGMLLPAVTTGIGLIWTIGLMAYLDVPIDIGTLPLPTLLIAIGNAYATHVVARAIEESTPGGDPREVARRTVAHLGVPVLVTWLTTVLGFASLVVYRIAAIRHLGWFAVFGITVLFALALTFTVAILAVLRRQTMPAARAGGGNVRLAAALDRLGHFDLRHRVAILIGALLVLVVFAWGIRYLRVETSYLTYFPEDSPVRQGADALVRYFGGGQKPFFIIVDGPGENAIIRRDTLQRIAALQDFVDRLPGVERTTSLVDYVKLLHRAFHDDDPAYYALPDTDAGIEQYLLLLDPEATASVTTADYSRAAILVRSNLHSSADMATAIDKIERFAADAFPPEFSILPTGTAVLLDRTADNLAQGQLQSVLTALVVVFAILSLQFLSLRFGLVAMVPNLVPIVVFFGILGWSGISLNLATAMIASISLGIGVDEAVHLLAEFNHHVRKHGDQRAAVLSALQSVGPPVVYNTAALALGFLVLCWSNLVPLRHFGALSAVNAVASLVSDLLLLPPLLMSTRFVTLWDVLGLKLGGAPQEEIPMFRGLRPSEARVAVLMGVLKVVPRGHKIVSQGEIAKEMYVMIDGRARIERRTDGRAFTLGEVRRGDVVGEMGLLRQQPRSADVIAVDDADLLVVDERFLEVLRRRYPRIAATILFNLTRLLSDRLEQADVGLAAPAMRQPTAS